MSSNIVSLMLSLLLLPPDKSRLFAWLLNLAEMWVMCLKSAALNLTQGQDWSQSSLHQSLQPKYRHWSFSGIHKFWINFHLKVVKVSWVSSSELYNVACRRLLWVQIVSFSRGWWSWWWWWWWWWLWWGCYQWSWCWCWWWWFCY